MIPIHRLSEGREYLALNDATFEKCGDILAGGGIVLIFVEGLCVNQWALRPLKKGAARIAWNVLKVHHIKDELNILPVGINYNGFVESGKRVIVSFSSPITFSQFPVTGLESEFIQQFNSNLSISLEQAVLCGTYPESGLIQWLISNCRNKFGITNANIIADLKIRYQKGTKNGALNRLKKSKPGIIASSAPDVVLNVVGIIILLIPACVGWLLHFPLIYPLRKFVYDQTKSTVFYDSALFGGLMILYPIYWMVLNILTTLVAKSILIEVVFLLMPAFSWLYLSWKDCMKRIQNYLLFPRCNSELLKEVLFA